MPPAPMSALLRGTLWMVLSAITFAASSASAKFLGQRLPAAELAFFRAVFGLLFLVGTWRAVVEIRNAREPGWYVVRCGLGVVALYALMYAFTTIPLGLASLIFLTRVLMLPVASQLMIGERASPAVWSALAIGFAGATVSLVPALAIPEMRPGVLAALVAAVASAGSQTAVRRLTTTNAPSVIVLIYVAVSVLATAPLMMPVWVAPPVGDWPVLAILGLFAVVAQYTAARSFASAPVPYLAPLDFLSVPAAALFGFVLFSETPNRFTIIGGALVLVAAVVVTVCERRRSGPP